MKLIVELSDRLKVFGAFGIEDLEQVRTDWEYICDHPNVDPDIIINSLRENKEIPYILIIKKDNLPVGIIVAVLKEINIQIKIGYFTLLKPKAKVLSILDNGIKGDELSDVAQSIIFSINQLMEESKCDYIHIACLDKDSILRELFRKYYYKRILEGPIEQRWLLELPGTFDEFLKKLSPSVRHDLKWRMKKIKKTFPQIETKIIKPNFEDNINFNHIKFIFNKTYQNKLNLSPLIDPIEEMKWKKLKELKKLLTIILFINDNPVAFGYGSIFKETCYFIATGYDPDYKKWYIGEYIWVEMIKEAIDLGLKFMDYGIGHSEKKRQFGNICLSEGHIRLFADNKRGHYLKLLIYVSMKINGKLKQILEILRIKNLIKRTIRRKI